MFSQNYIKVEIVAVAIDMGARQQVKIWSVDDYCKTLIIRVTLFSRS